MNERRNLTYLDFLRGRVQTAKSKREPTYLDFLKGNQFAHTTARKPPKRA